MAIPFAGFGRTRLASGGGDVRGQALSPREVAGRYSQFRRNEVARQAPHYAGGDVQPANFRS